MGLNVSYMGTKKHLANFVAGAIAKLPTGPVLDAFSGMGAVGEALANDRNVWVNDCQQFAANASKAIFTSRLPPPPSNEVKEILTISFKKNMDALKTRFADQLNAERRYLKSGRLDHVIKGNTELPFVGSCVDLENQRKRLSKKPGTFPYRMATITYVGSYFGVQQCFEIDSLVYAIDIAKNQGRISAEAKRWFLLALCQVSSRVNNSTGQFAHYLKPKRHNIARIINQRRRSVFEEFLTTIDEMTPIGTAEWRRDNRAFKCDALSLLPKLKRQPRQPAIVYADPPYTKAEYPRYYHVLDMLFEYRYPVAIGVGRYPDGRTDPRFSRLRTVCEEMRCLIERVADMDASLVLSYPNTGLLHQQNIAPKELLREFYRNVRTAYSGNHDHSTFGGPNAESTIRAREYVYVASAAH